MCPFVSAIRYMRQGLTLVFFFLCFGCGERKAQTISVAEPDPNIPAPSVPVDTTDGQPFRAVIQEGTGAVPLSVPEIKFVDSLLERQVEEHNRKSEKGHAIDLAKYNRQYFPRITADGEKVVEVNCFCEVSKDDDWKRLRLKAQDGGECYFHLKVNLTTRRVVRFYTNGTV